jgi:hypothetical protein
MAKDAFDRWHEWANKPLDSMLTIPPEIHRVVTKLTQDERQDATLNETVRTGCIPLRPAGSADKYGVPRARNADATEG